MAFWRELIGWLEHPTAALNAEIASVQNILTRVEALKPFWTTEDGDLGSGNHALYYRVLDNHPWSILMTFTENTPDGELITRVYSSPHFALVKVNLKYLDLKTVAYATASSDGHMYPAHSYRSPSKVMEGVLGNSSNVIGVRSDVVVRYVREWVLQRVAPELEEARARNRAASQQYEVRLETMRKKYVP